MPVTVSITFLLTNTLVLVSKLYECIIALYGYCRMGCCDLGGKVLICKNPPNRRCCNRELGGKGPIMTAWKATLSTNQIGQQSKFF